MGAFVGNVTSPFLKRRKGRVGKDVIQSLVAPTFLGNPLSNLSVGLECAIAAPAGIDATYQVSRDFGASAWLSFSLPVPPNDRIGQTVVAADSALKVRPFGPRMSLDLWHLQMAHYGYGRTGAILGAQYQISPNGGVNKQNFNMGGGTNHCYGDWSEDGRRYLAAGDAPLGNVAARGNFTDDTPDAPIAFTYSIPSAGNGCQSVFAFNERTDLNRYAFMTYNLPGSAPGIFKLVVYQKKTNTWSNGGNISSPLAGLPGVGHFMQIRNKLMGFDSSNPNMVFATATDNYNSFTAVAIGNGGGPIAGAFKWGRRIYAVCRDVSRIRMSNDYGVTWTASPVQPPDAGAQLNAAAYRPFTGEIYITGNDGVVNRFYRFRPFADI